MADPGAPRKDARFDRSSIWLFIAAVTVRVLYTVLRDVGNPIPFGTDAQSYDTFARAILSGTDWIAHPGPELFRPPGYPMTLAVLYLVTAGHLAIVQLLQSIVGALSVVLVFELGRRRFGRTPALLAAIWLLVNPLHLDYSGKLLRETWLVFLNVALVASLLARDGLSTKGVIRTALLTTVLVHFDSRYVFHLPFFAAYFAIVAGGDGRRLAIRRAVRPTALFVLCVVLFSAPWAIRNAVAYDHFVLIDPRTIDRWGRRARTSVTGDVLSGGTALERFEAQKDSAFAALTLEEQAAWRAGVRPTRGQPAKAIFNFTEFWRIVHLKPEYRPLPDGRFAPPWSPEHNVSSLIFMGLLLPGFVLGSWYALQGRNTAALLFLAFIAVHTLLHVLVHSVVRYRLPVEPLVALVSFWAMTSARVRQPVPRRGDAVSPPVEVAV